MSDERNMYAGFLSGNALKIIACVTMLIDHIGMMFFPDVVVWRIIGRLSMPLFAFTFAEGCHYTRNKIKHFVLVLAMGIVTSVGMSVAAGYFQGNILVTLSMSCLLIYALDGIKRSAFGGDGRMAAIYAVAFALVAGGSVWLCCFSGIYIDYGIAGVALPLTVRLLDFRSFGATGMLADIYNPATVFTLFAIGLIVLAVVLGPVQAFGIFAMIPVAMYSGKRGTAKLKYMFYVFYPAHLIVLAVIYVIVFPSVLTG